MPKKAKAPKKMDGQSKQPVENILNCLKTHAPEVFTEDKIDPKKLQKSLGNELDNGEERYGLNWAGKTDCFREIQQTTSKTLKPDRKESVKFDETGNIFIEGENLQVLKILQGSYYGKIKMIYIDPPYNTGNDFIYDDNFAQTKKEYLQKAGAIDKDGNILEDGLYHRNTRDSGHFHSNWLNMMYPRLYLARNLLRDDGVIFVSIDDNEVHNLRMIMNEIFGEENFIAQIVAQTNPRGRTLDKFLAKTFEYVLIFAKTESDNSIYQIPKNEIALLEYNKIDKDGKFRLLELRNRNPVFSRQNRPNLFYPIYIDPKTKAVSLKKDKVFTQEALPLNTKEEDGCWTWGKEKVAKNLNLLIGKKVSTGYWRVYRKDYIPPTGAITKEKTLWLDKKINHENGKEELGQLFGKTPFDFPKSTELIKKMINIGMQKNDIALDFFAGSGTTTNAVMQLNAEDGGNRKCISVQLPEACNKDSEAFKAGYKTIADIAKERIRRAAKKIKKENKDVEFDDGFKVFKMDDSNFKIWNTRIENQKQLEQQLMDFVDNVQKGVTDENLLYELLIKSGQDLNVEINEKKVDKHTYYRIGDGDIIICLDKITDKLLETMLEDKPKKLIILERAFSGKDQLMTNTLLRANNAGVEDVRVI